jgi:hypothetical protein
MLTLPHTNILVQPVLRHPPGWVEEKLQELNLCSLQVHACLGGAEVVCVLHGLKYHSKIHRYLKDEMD